MDNMRTQAQALPAIDPDAYVDLQSALAEIPPVSHSAVDLVASALKAYSDGFRMFRIWAQIDWISGEYDTTDSNLQAIWDAVEDTSGIGVIFGKAQACGWKPGKYAKDKIKPVLPMLTAAEFNAMVIPEPEPILQGGVFSVGDKLEIIAASKSYKSWICQQLGMCVATGTPFFGIEAGKPRKVHFIQFEIGDYWAQQRMRMAQDALGVAESELFLQNMTYTNLRGHDLTHLWQMLADAVQPGALVILDPVYLILQDENDIIECKEFVHNLDRFAKESGVSIVYAHHDKKGGGSGQSLTDRGSGSSVLGRACDSRMVVSQHAEVDQGIVAQWVLRNGKPPAALSLQFEEGVLVPVDDEPEIMSLTGKGKPRPKPRDLISDRHLVLEYVQKEGPVFGVKDMCAHIERILDMTPTAAKRFKEDMVREGYLVQGDPVKGYRGKSFIYLEAQEKSVEDTVREMQRK